MDFASSGKFSGYENSLDYTGLSLMVRKTKTKRQGRQGRQGRMKEKEKVYSDEFKNKKFICSFEWASTAEKLKYYTSV